MELGKKRGDRVIDAFIGHTDIDVASKKFARLFGAEVKIRRITVGLRQEELAEIAQSYGIQVSQSYLSRLEGGQRDDPGIALIIVLAIVLNISLDRIIFLARSDANVTSDT